MFKKHTNRIPEQTKDEQIALHFIFLLYTRRPYITCTIYDNNNLKCFIQNNIIYLNLGRK